MWLERYLSTSDKEEKITALSKELDKTPAKELAATAIRAAIDALPFVGGPISTLVEELIPNWKLQRLQRFVAALRVDLESLGSKIDVECLRKEEFGYLFEKTFRGVIMNYQAEKLDALKNILLNSMIATDVKQELKEYLLSVLENLSSLHMRFIALLEAPSEFYKSKGLQDGSAVLGGSLIQEMRKCFPELDDNTIRAVWSDLYNYGIVNTQANVLGAMISSTGSKALEGRLSEFGRLLTRFIRSPSGPT
jgi:hypothetical protein